MTSEDRPFWSLPKRAPTPQVFSADNDLHVNFIAAYASLLAFRHGVNIPHENPRSEEAKKQMAKEALTFEMKQFVPNSKKA
jgi:hypothetical protein